MGKHPIGESSSSTHRAVRRSSAAAVAVLLMTGLGYRSLMAWYEAPAGHAAIPPGSLARLPLEIGGWSGQDVAIDPRVVAAADAEDHVFRTYTRGGQSVVLWIAYGIRLRDLAPHRPEVCYPGRGWTLEEASTAELPSAGSGAGCQLHRFSRGGLQRNGAVVLSYYVVNGQHCADVSMLRRQAWRGAAAGPQYALQVQVFSEAEPSAAAVQAVQAFAEDSVRIIRRTIDRAVATSTRPA